MKKSVVPLLLALVVFQAGVLLGQSGAFDAVAEPGIDAVEAVETVADAPMYDPPRLFCKPFSVPLEGGGAAIETNDRTTAIGKWLAAEEESYELFSIDFEVAQKATGYPTGVAYVCLSPR